MIRKMPPSTGRVITIDAALRRQPIRRYAGGNQAHRTRSFRDDHGAEFTAVEITDTASHPHARDGGYRAFCRICNPQRRERR